MASNNGKHADSIPAGIDRRQIGINYDARKDEPKDTRHTASLIRHSLIQEPRHRAISVFFGKEDYSQTAESYPALIADLMLECLPAFVRQRGGRIVCGMQFGRDGQANITECQIDIEGERRSILSGGTLFLDLGGRRAALTAIRDGFGSNWYCHLTLAAEGDAAELAKDWADYARRHNYLRGRAFFPDGRLIQARRKRSWDDIVIPRPIRDMVVRQVQEFLANRDALREMGLRLRRGLILAGPSGTGKTLLCKILSQQVNASCIWVLPRHVQSVDSFQEILELAHLVTPAVLILEDIDLFGEDRESGRSAVLGELMNQLDGAAEHEDLITIATTNRLDVVEKALRNRPGRFDRIIELLPPDEDSRRLLLRKLFASTRISDADLDWSAHASSGYTGAQLQEVANTVLMRLATADGTNSPTVDRVILETALAEAGIDRKRLMGFH